CASGGLSAAGPDSW
nr:immunoglobulin heavy chain junction region [Macaca mulatta]